ncbi:hypothetical protein V502_06729 [Pseudogymnoascus sp. VKM F-4520 (FW-2644)]|nr:hypothetical protein V502_06729 [Pseudogymnoascus sp. VKM F-4520 (FW-2644)]
MSDSGRGRGRPKDSHNYDPLEVHILHRADPDFDVATIGPYLGPELEADLQASRYANDLLQESFQDTISDTEIPAAAVPTSDFVTEAESAPAPQLHAPQQGPLEMPDLPSYPDNVRNWTAAGRSRPSGSASGPPRQEEADPEPVAQLQDLIFQPGGVPDLLPPNLSQMPGLDPIFLGTGPDGLPNLPAPPEFPLPDLETQFKALLAQTEFANAVEAAGLAEQVVAPKKLVVVCCLATWTGMRGTDDKWVAMPGQGTNQGWGMDMANPSERGCWRMQIWKGLEVLKKMDGEGVLMFSGGPWYDRSKISAAESYHDFAKASKFWGFFKDDKYKNYPSRIFTEDRAMDSLQNVMFSLIEFNNRYKNFPEEMTVISYELKRDRFEKLHFKTAKELMLPTAQPETDVSWQGIPTFIGIDPREPKQSYKCDKANALMELEAKIFDLWKGSPFGLSSVLMGRKKQRNLWKIDLTYRLVFAGGAELVAALERNAKEAPSIEEVIDMSVN